MAFIIFHKDDVLHVYYCHIQFTVSLLLSEVCILLAIMTRLLSIFLFLPFGPLEYSVTDILTVHMFLTMQLNVNVNNVAIFHV